jgi:hypothetical protein
MPTTLTTAAPVAVTLGWNESNLILVTSSDPGGYWCVGANDCTGDYGRGSTWVFVSSTTPPPRPHPRRPHAEHRCLLRPRLASGRCGRPAGAAARPG